MILGKVLGEVWATRKHERLEGRKAMLVAVLDRGADELRPSGEVIVALDTIGAKTGHVVTVSWGSGARAVFKAPDNRSVLVDAAISRIIDGVTSSEEGPMTDLQYTED